MSTAQPKRFTYAEKIEASVSHHTAPGSASGRFSAIPSAIPSVIYGAVDAIGGVNR
ncbi:hypothetical protein IWX88_000839 [Frigoribacterium sp. CG_9.8]|nr:hypothetical protein [Frigoribacterium sp. CG_9.8]